jgi:hypothetical protein
MRYIKNNNPESAFDLHILNNRDEYGRVDEFMTTKNRKAHAKTHLIWKIFHPNASPAT